MILEILSLLKLFVLQVGNILGHSKSKTEEITMLIYLNDSVLRVFIRIIDFFD